MHYLIQKFKQSIAWYSFEALIYQSILVIHQIFLYSIVGSQTYAQQSILFAYIYLIVELSQFGLDTSLMPFFIIWSQNKQAFKRFFFYQLIPNYSVMASIILFLYYGAFFMISPTLFMILICIIIGESTKRIAKIIIQQLFKMQTVTVFEIASIILYSSSVWTLYLLGFHLTMHTIFLPMAITSCITTLWYTIMVYRWYKALPESREHIFHKNFEQRIIKSRLFTYMHTLATIFFSTNCLILLLSIYLPSADIGIFSIISHIFQPITLMIRKSLIPSTGAAFAHIKDAPTHTKYEIFHYVTRIINTIMYLSIVSFAVFYSIIYAYIDSHNRVFFIFISIYHLIQLCMIAYEKWYILNEKLYILMILMFAITGAMSILAFSLPVTATYILMLISLGQVSMVCGTVSITWYLWRLVPHFTVYKPLFYFGLLIIGIARLFIYLWLSF